MFLLTVFLVATLFFKAYCRLTPFFVPFIFGWISGGFFSCELIKEGLYLSCLYIFLLYIYLYGCFSGHVLYTTRNIETNSAREHSSCIIVACVWHYAVSEEPFWIASLDHGRWVLFYRAFCIWITGFVGLRSSRNRHVCWHTATTILMNLVNHGRETKGGQRRVAENVYSSTYIKLSSMWEKRNDGYVERLSATNAHKSEDFRTACRRLWNNGYIERRSAINALIRAKIFKLSAIWDKRHVRCDRWGAFYTQIQLAGWDSVQSLRSIRTSPRTPFYPTTSRLRYRSSSKINTAEGCKTVIHEKPLLF